MPRTGDALASFVVRALLRKLWKRVQALWVQVWNENASPRQVGWAIAVGVYCGTSPFWGLRWLLAVGFATVFRLNRLLTYVGSRLSSNFVVTVPMALLEVQLAHKLRTGEFLSIGRADFEAIEAPNDLLEKVKGILEFVLRILVDFTLGSVIVGIPSRPRWGSSRIGWRATATGGRSSPRGPSRARAEPLHFLHRLRNPRRQHLRRRPP